MKAFGPDLYQEMALPAPVALVRRVGGIQLFVLSFAALIGLGTLGLLLLPGLYTGESLGFVDALFTATSAVCVTGLIVVDTATYFTPLGQAWLLALIQAGGLGILTFTTLIFAALGRRTSLRLTEATAGHAAILRHVESEHLVRTIMLVTFSLEAIGGILLWVLWQDEMGWVGAIWPAVFHAVSAFCNAGFSVFSDSLMGFRSEQATLFVLGLLVVGGGLGFVVMEDLRAFYLRKAVRRLSAHTRLVLTTTTFLLLLGWVLFLMFEWRYQLAGLSFSERVANAGFMAVTPRTAGFNSVDYAGVTNASIFLTIILMLVGGSPGSTAGGFKTVTVALLFLMMVTHLKGERQVHVFHRTVPRETISRAIGLVMGGLALLGASVFFLLVSESALGGLGDRSQFVRLVFEAHSAFATVGLSMGATPELSTPGRLLVTLLMFLGRLGPPAVVATMFTARVRHHPRFRYGEEDVIIG